MGYRGEFSMESCVFLCRCVGISCRTQLDSGCVGNIGGDVAMEVCKILSGNEVGNEVGRFTCSVIGWVRGDM